MIQTGERESYITEEEKECERSDEKSENEILTKLD